MFPPRFTSLAGWLLFASSNVGLNAWATEANSYDTQRVPREEVPASPVCPLGFRPLGDCDCIESGDSGREIVRVTHPSEACLEAEAKRTGRRPILKLENGRYELGPESPDSAARSKPEAAEAPNEGSDGGKKIEKKSAGQVRAERLAALERKRAARKAEIAANRERVRAENEEKLQAKKKASAAAREERAVNRRAYLNYYRDYVRKHKQSGGKQ